MSLTGLNFLLLAGFFALFLMVYFHQALTKEKNGFALVLLVLLFVLLCLRQRGWDLSLYEAIYDNAKLYEYHFFGSGLEFGFLFVIKTLKSFELDFFVFNLIWSLITVLLLRKIISKELGFPVVALFLFFCFYFYRGPAGQIRQAMAMLLFLYSLRWVHDSMGRYMVLNIIGSSIHTIGLLGIPFILFARVSSMGKRSYVYALLTVICMNFIVSNRLMDYFLSMLGGIPLFDKFSFYVTNFAITGGWLSLEFIRVIIVTLVVALYYPDFRKLSGYVRVLLLSFLSGAVLFFILSFDLRMASRASRIFLIVDFLIIAKSFEYMNKYTRAFYAALLCMVGLVFLALEFEMMKAAIVKYSWN